MIKNDQITEVADLMSNNRILNATFNNTDRVSLVGIVIENRKAAALERIADALTAIAGKSA